MTPTAAAALLDDASGLLADAPSVPADVDRTVDRLTDAFVDGHLDLDAVDPILVVRFVVGLLRAHRARRLAEEDGRRRETRIAVEQVRHAAHVAAAGLTAADYDTGWADGT